MLQHSEPSGQMPEGKPSSTTHRNGAAALWPFPRIRPALSEEIDELLAMCRKLHEENGIGSELDETKVKAILTRGMKGSLTYIGVIGSEGRMEGSICLEIEPSWYGAQEFWLAERWNFVLPEYRKSDNAKQLIKFAKWLSDELSDESISRGHPPIPLMIGILSNQRTEAKIRLYRRELGEPAGAFFLYNGKTGH